jgi:hypothetical protein
MSTLDNELASLHRAPHAPLDLDWLTKGQRYQVTDENNPRNILPQINEQHAANRSNVLADPRLLREMSSREQQSVARAVLRALHEGLQGLGLRNRLINELGAGTIAKHRMMIESLISANEGKAGVYLVDPLACWPNCGDVVQEVNSANPLKPLVLFVKASAACAGCGQRKGNRCASCHMDLIAPHQDLPKGFFARAAQLLASSSLTPDRVRTAAAAIEAVDGFSEKESVELLVRDLVSRMAAPTTTKIETSGIHMSGESELPVDVCKATSGKDSDQLLNVSVSSLDESVMGSVPPNILNMDENLQTSSDDECKENDSDIELEPKRKVDGISVVLDDNLEVTL